MSARRNPSDLIFAGLVGALAAVLIMFVFTWVTDGDDAGATTSQAAPTSSPATTATSTAGTFPAATTTVAPTTTVAFEGDVATKIAAGEPFGIPALLAGVRVAQREGFTRVVFDFEGDAVPWWEVGYAPGPFPDAGGEEVRVEGGAYLRVLMSATGVDLTGGEPRITYAGPVRIAAATASVVEIVRAEDFEGVSAWVIGVSGERPFRVGALLDPPRLYVDVAD